MKLFVRLNSFSTNGSDTYSDKVLLHPYKNVKGKKGIQMAYTDLLPRYERRGIDWKKSVGMEFPVQFKKLVGVVKILDYRRINNIPELLAKFNDIQKWVRPHVFTLPNMGIFLNQTRTDYIYNIEDIITTPHTQLLVKDRRIGISKNRHGREYLCECLGCHDIRWRKENEIVDKLDKYICGICQGQECKTGFNDIAVRAPWMIPYFQGGKEEAQNYTPGSGTKKFFICPYCGRIQTKAKRIYELYNQHSLGCVCEQKWPYGDGLLAEVLEQQGVEFIHDQSLPWSNNKRYDFIIKKHKIIIEVDGEMGHGTERDGKTQEQIEKEIEIDLEKTKMAENNGYQLFRIKYIRDHKKDLVNEIQNKLPSFLWDKVNWDDAYINMHAGKRYNICIDYENSDKSGAAIRKIGEKYHYKEGNIRKILKEGVEFGWCDYPLNKPQKEKTK